MIKLVFFSGPSQEIPPKKGAAVQTWIYEIAKQLDKSKFEVHVISVSYTRTQKVIYQEGIFFHKIYFSSAYKRVFQKILGWDIFSYRKRISRLIDNIQPNIVHIHNEYNCRDIVKHIRKKYINTQIVFHMHNLSSALVTNKIPEVDVFAGCSDFIVNSYKDVVKAKYYKTIYNGVDINKFSQYDQSSLIPLNDTKSICFFGRISPEKGIDKILELALLMGNDQRYTFQIFGEISQKGERLLYYKSLIAYINEHKLTNVKFMGVVSPDEIHHHYQQADMVLIPSLCEEAFCMVAIEAMASKTPVICSFKGGMKEYIKDAENAMVIFDLDNFAPLAQQKILDYYNEQYSSITQNAFDLVNERFDWAIISNTTEDIYAQIT